ncbi:hypothetical protein GOP47_0000678 [Adiantum capillus-veneris]|uniref:Cytochrome b5 heme-binding domain-containing protein n=1 Tax=Adiantum capillus-veneris TaxID=13818 RepID=A0A9D4VDR9_ADICA|nr:hypothetical protein GOP47_0000678 [Adiantum capillus-veneris]
MDVGKAESFKGRFKLEEALLRKNLEEGATSHRTQNPLRVTLLQAQAEEATGLQKWAMDQPLDFSFHKDNPLAVTDDELESPKPMPKPQVLFHVAAEANVDPVSDANEVAAFPSIAVEVMETLSISPTRSLTSDEEISRQPSTSSALDSSTSGLVVDNSNGSIPKVPKFSDESQTSSPKPKARAKIPLERGFTQVDWLRITRTQTDLAGLKGATNRRLITKAEVKQHRSEDDAWTILKGRVYNITPYLKFHPGGVDMIMKGAGKDCTALFNKYHSWVNAEYLLEKCLVGFLDTES